MGKHTRPRVRRLSWLLIWLIQFAAMLLVSAITALSILGGSFVHALFQWGLMPLSGFISAMWATRKGLLNYVAWIAPPVMMFAGNLLIWGYALSTGPVFLCGFVALVGAATGEVLNRQGRR